MKMRVQYALATIAVLCFVAQQAGAQTSLKATQQPTEQQARAFLDSYLSGHPRVNYVKCGGLFSGDSPISGHEMTSESVRITFCRGKQSLELKFADLPFAGTRHNKELCVGTKRDAEYYFA